MLFNTWVSLVTNLLKYFMTSKTIQLCMYHIHLEKNICLTFSHFSLCVQNKLESFCQGLPFFSISVFFFFLFCLIKFSSFKIQMEYRYQNSYKGFFYYYYILRTITNNTRLMAASLSNQWLKTKLGIRKKVSPHNKNAVIFYWRWEICKMCWFQSIPW